MSCISRPRCPRGPLRPKCIGPIMPMKPIAGRFAGRFRGGTMFPGLMFKPGQGGALPLLGRRRFAVGGFGKRFQPAKIYGRLGTLEVRLARKKSEIRRAQRLRYKVFYEEMSALSLIHISEPTRPY